MHCYRFLIKILTLKQRVMDGCGSAREFLRRGFDVSWWLDMSLQEGDAGRWGIWNKNDILLENNSANMKVFVIQVTFRYQAVRFSEGGGKCLFGGRVASEPLCDTVFLNNDVYKRNYWQCFGGAYMVIVGHGIFRLLPRQKVKMLWEVKSCRALPPPSSYIQRVRVCVITLPNPFIYKSCK